MNNCDNCKKWQIFAFSLFLITIVMVANTLVAQAGWRSAIAGWKFALNQWENCEASKLDVPQPIESMCVQHIDGTCLAYKNLSERRMVSSIENGIVNYEYAYFVDVLDSSTKEILCENTLASSSAYEEYACENETGCRWAGNISEISDVSINGIDCQHAEYGILNIDGKNFSCILSEDGSNCQIFGVYT